MSLYTFRLETEAAHILKEYIAAYRNSPILATAFSVNSGKHRFYISQNVAQETAAYEDLSEREKIEIKIILEANKNRHKWLIGVDEVQRLVAERMGEAQAADGGAGVAGPPTVASSAALAVPGTSVSYSDDERLKIGAEAWAATLQRGGLGDALGVSSETRKREREAFERLDPKLRENWIDYAVLQCMTRSESSHVPAEVASVPVQPNSQRLR